MGALPPSVAAPGTAVLAASAIGYTSGNNIETENRRQGSGGKPLCDECKRLNASAR